MAEKPRTIEQTIVRERFPPIVVQTLHEKAITDPLLTGFLQTAVKSSVGVAQAYNPSGSLACIALATPTQVLLIQPYSAVKQKNPKKQTPQLSGRNLLCKKLLCNPEMNIFAFDAHHLVIALHLDMRISVTSVVDLQSLTPGNTTREPSKTAKAALGTEIDLYDPNFYDAFRDELWDLKRRDQLAQRAWVSQLIGTLDSVEMMLASVPRINTTDWDDAELDVLSRTLRDAVRLDSIKPTSVTHSVTNNWSHRDDNLVIASTRFQNRIRKAESDHQTVQVTVGSGNSFVVTTQAGAVEGRMATIPLQGNFEGKTIQSITTHGKDGPTLAEVKRSVTVLQTLQRKIPLFENEWIQKIWVSSRPVPEQLVSADSWGEILPSDADPWSIPSSDSSAPLSNTSSEPAQPTATTLPRNLLHAPPLTFSRTLNDSQSQAVEKMLSHCGDTDITVVQGPPGTGKTTVIAAFVSSILAGSQRVVYLTAKTNVAVKNIAEKLADCGIVNWRLIVSQDFHLGWHEHLYNDMLKDNVLTSDKLLPKNFKGCKIILCTLSMLSNKRLNDSCMSRSIPLETLVIDEASQIEIGDYIPVLSKFGKTLQKICFIGDDKQLPPFGQENIDTLESVFEKPHLCSGALFLDTQYRMPVPIGDFISKHVYNGKLLSNSQHPVHSRDSCQFFDISEGVEEADGTSWKNLKEVEAVVQIVQWLVSKGRQFRVITPYDPQRNIIERELKDAGLPWEDKCFNVDSFQGNEEEIIIISVVRSAHLGFLNNLRRTNVMLSRCKQGMYICSSHKFMKNIAAQTLLGKMAKAWEGDGWVTRDELMAGNFKF